MEHFYNNITVFICSHISCGTFDGITFAQEAFHNINCKTYLLFSSYELIIIIVVFGEISNAILKIH